MAKIVIRNLTKTYGGGEVVALHDINLEVEANESVCVLGPSGCGKTTLLRIVDSLIPRDRGEVLMDGALVSAPRPDVAVVFQHFGLFPWKRLDENIAYGLALRGASKQQTAMTVARYLQLMGLKEFAKSYPHQLSGGMQQRAGLARALAINPSLLLMDEPFGALDAQTREMMQEELLRILETEQKTMIFVTHSIDEAILLGDRIVVMSCRPGTIRKIVAVDIPRPRKIISVRAHPRYIELQKFSLGDAYAGSRQPRRANGGAMNRKFIVRTISFIVVLLLWEFYGRRVNPILFTYPSAIARAFITLVASGELQSYMKESLLVLTYASILSLIAGVFLGVIMGRFSIVEWAADIYINALYSTPMVAVVPLIVLWFGFKVPAKVIIVFLFMVFPVLLNTYEGVKNVDRNLQEVARAFCSSESQLWRHLIVPSAIPFIVAGVRLAIGRGLVGMIVAEFYTSVTGLGYMIVRYANALETDKLFVPIVVVMLLGVGLMSLAKWVEGRIAPWRNSLERD